MVAVNLLFGPASSDAGLNIFPGLIGSLGGYALDDSNDAESLLLIIPKDGTISEIGLLVTEVVGSPPDYNFALTTVDSSENPTQTAYGGSSIEVFNPVSTGWKWQALGTDATASEGDLVAIHIWPGATPPTTSNCIDVSNDVLDYFPLFPQGKQFATSWSNRGGPISMAVKYNDGSIYGYPIDEGIQNIFDSLDSPDEVGCKFIFPFDAVCFGFRIFIADGSPDADFDAILYDSSNNILKSRSVSDPNMFAFFSAVDFWFDNINLYKDLTYRLVIKSTNTTLTVTVGGLRFPSLTEKGTKTMVGLNNWSKTERTDGGSWTDTDTQVMWMALWLNDISTGTGETGSGGSNRFGYVG